MFPGGPFALLSGIIGTRAEKVARCFLRGPVACALSKLTKQSQAAISKAKQAKQSYAS